MRTCLIVACLLPLAACASVYPGAEQLTRKVEQQGAETVISGLYADNEKGWQYVTGQIATGESPWLHVASLLAPGADADAAESLSSAVALAIPHNPVGVLGIITDRTMALSLGQVCGLPFYTMSEAELNQYVLDAIRALYKVPSGKACMDTMINTIGQSEGYQEDN